MDTAQRGIGLDWATTQELIARSAAQAREYGARIASGAGTDHLAADVDSLDEVLAGYETQLSFVESTGSQAILMASRQLARAATGFDDYAKVYDRLLTQAERPVIMHWLGTAFDPAWRATGAAPTSRRPRQTSSTSSRPPRTRSMA